MYPGQIRRRVFISYSHLDETEANNFIYQFTRLSKVFDPYAIGIGDNDDFINSTDPQYVMSRIRQCYLKDTTVTIVLAGSCTHSRRYIDWELKASLRQGTYTPNGVMGIILPSCGDRAIPPPRLLENCSGDNGNFYARWWVYPNTPQELASYIEDAYAARTNRAHLIKNSAEMMKYNARCRVCNVTH